MCASGCVARPATAGLIRAQVAHSQHIRIRLQPLQYKPLWATYAESREKGTGIFLQSQIEEGTSFQTTWGVWPNFL